MLAYIKGVAIKKYNNFIIVVNSNIGYKVYLTQNAYKKIKEGDTVSLFTHQIIGENKNELYGFFSFEEMNFFELLNSVSGVGPKSALAIINLGNITKLKSAISNADYKYLTKVSGIGSKTAKKIILELQEKLAENNIYDLNTENIELLIDALEKLGYKQKEIKSILNKIDFSKTLEGQIKEALKLLMKQ